MFFGPIVCIRTGVGAMGNTEVRIRCLQLVRDIQVTVIESMHSFPKEKCRCIVI